jgi:hypothetical protein
MNVVIAVAAGLLVLAAAAFAWGVARLRRNSAQLQAAIRGLTPEQIPELAGACAHVFASRLGRPLDAGDPLACVKTLDESVSSLACTRAFARPDLEWAYVLHCGAYLGELLRLHADGRWQVVEGEGPMMLLGEGEAEVRTWPIEKILKHRMQGDPGDLVAYFEVSRRGPAAIVAAATGTHG